MNLTKEILMLKRQRWLSGIHFYAINRFCLKVWRKMQYCKYLMAKLRNLVSFKPKNGRCILMYDSARILCFFASFLHESLGFSKGKDHIFTQFYTIERLQVVLRICVEWLILSQIQVDGLKISQICLLGNYLEISNSSCYKQQVSSTH